MANEERWRTLEEARSEAVVCCRCDLCRSRTLVVFGEGPAPARLMIVGEGPGAREDKEGRPFVGPAGKMLDEMLLYVGIRREDTWVTNIVRCRPLVEHSGVQHNRSPRADEIRACDLWMTQEYRFVRPGLVVCLGATPAQALMSKSFRISESRGEWQAGKDGIQTTATYHPAYALRLQGRERRTVEAQMLEDLHIMAARLAEVSREPQPIPQISKRE